MTIFPTDHTAKFVQGPFLRVMIPLPENPNSPVQYASMYQVPNPRNLSTVVDVRDYLNSVFNLTDGKKIKIVGALHYGGNLAINSHDQGPVFMIVERECEITDPFHLPDSVAREEINVVNLDQTVNIALIGFSASEVQTYLNSWKKADLLSYNLGKINLVSAPVFVSSQVQPDENTQPKIVTYAEYIKNGTEQIKQEASNFQEVILITKHQDDGFVFSDIDQTFVYAKLDKHQNITATTIAIKIIRDKFRIAQNPSPQVNPQIGVKLRIRDLDKSERFFPLGFSPKDPETDSFIIKMKFDHDESSANATKRIQNNPQVELSLVNETDQKLFYQVWVYLPSGAISRLAAFDENNFQHFGYDPLVPSKLGDNPKWFLLNTQPKTGFRPFAMLDDFFTTLHQLHQDFQSEGLMGFIQILISPIKGLNFQFYHQFPSHEFTSNYKGNYHPDSIILNPIFKSIEIPIIFLSDTTEFIYQNQSNAEFLKLLKSHQQSFYLGGSNTLLKTIVSYMIDGIPTGDNIRRPPDFVELCELAKSDYKITTIKKLDSKDPRRVNAGKNHYLFEKCQQDQSSSSSPKKFKVHHNSPLAGIVFK